MQAILFGSVEMQMLWWSVVLGLFNLCLLVLLGSRDREPYNFTARDDRGPPVGKLTARCDRAFKNFLETFPFFAVAVLMAMALHRSTPRSEWGAEIYFWSRVAYLPAYLAGILYVRTAVWFVSLAGIGLVLLTVWPGI